MRHDFTFRTKLFETFPKVTRPQPGFKSNVGQKYDMVCTIREDGAEYSIDGKPYASATYDKGTVPSKGHFGFAVYLRNEHKIITNLKVVEL